MAETPCAEVYDWLQRPEHAPPTVAMSDHVAGCPRCRGALAAIMAGLLGVGQPGQPPSCAECEDDLPAYLDAVRGQGEARAAARYPHVWWHLWVCPACAEVAHLTGLLIDADAAGEVRPFPRVALPSPAPVSMRLPRGFLRQAFGARAALGAAMSGAEGAEVLTEREIDGYQITINVRRQGPEGWTVEVAVDPPAGGHAILSFGPIIFSAPLDGQGVARLDAIPDKLLAGGSGPDLLMTLGLAGAP